MTYLIAEGMNCATFLIGTSDTIFTNMKSIRGHGKFEGALEMFHKEYFIFYLIYIQKKSHKRGPVT